MIVKPVKRSPFVARALSARLPYKVYADLRTDTRTDVVRESANDILRRTMPRQEG